MNTYEFPRRIDSDTVFNGKTMNEWMAYVRTVSNSQQIPELLTLAQNCLWMLERRRGGRLELLQDATSEAWVLWFEGPSPKWKRKYNKANREGTIDSWEKRWLRALSRRGVDRTLFRHLLLGESVPKYATTRNGPAAILALKNEMYPNEPDSPALKPTNGWPFRNKEKKAIWEEQRDRVIGVLVTLLVVFQLPALGAILQMIIKLVCSCVRHTKNVLYRPSQTFRVGAIFLLSSAGVYDAYSEDEGCLSSILSSSYYRQAFLDINTSNAWVNKHVKHGPPVPLVSIEDKETNRTIGGQIDQNTQGTTSAPEDDDECVGDICASDYPGCVVPRGIRSERTKIERQNNEWFTRFISYGWNVNGRKFCHTGPIVISLKGLNLDGIHLSSMGWGRVDLTGVSMKNAVLRGGFYTTIFDYADMTGVDCRNVEFSEVSFNAAILIHADCRGADLTGTILTNADLGWADFREVDFRSAYLQGADLWGAKLFDSKFRGANISKADLRWAGLVGADLRGAYYDSDTQWAGFDYQYSGAIGPDSKYVEADMRNIDFSGLDLSGIDFHGANLRGANFRGANLSGANFMYADLREVDFRGADLRNANMKKGNLDRADFRGADLSGADLSGSILRGADLSGANLSGTLQHLTIRGTSNAYSSQKIKRKKLVTWNIRLSLAKNRTPK